MTEPLPAVLIPGLQADAAAWTHQVGEFGRALVLPGGYHRAGSIEAMGRAIAKDLPPRMHLVGWSMGGYIALSLLEQLAGRLASLTLVATTARDEAGAPRAGRAQTIPRAKAVGMRCYQRETLETCFAEPADVGAPVAQRMIQSSERLGLDGLEAQIAAVVARPDRRSVLPGIDVPTLVIVGAQDTIIPPALSEEMAHAIPGARLEIVPRAGHCLPVERPDVFNATLGPWLEACD